YEYAPDGIEAEFTCVPDSYRSHALLEYISVSDTAQKTSVIPGEKAILSAGSYILSVTVKEGDKNKSASVQTTVRVLPATVRIVTPYNKSAYSDMDNPPEFYLQPEWAKDIITLSAEYYSVSDLSSGEYTKVDVPKDIGQYFVKIRPHTDNDSVKCEMKQFVYEIAVTGGNRLSDAEAANPVPSWFSANVKDVIATYNGESVVTEYTVNPSLTECELRYRLLLYTDSSNEFTTVPPVEPGDYQAACFASGMIIGESSISIEKLDCSITLKDSELDFDPAGFSPEPEAISPSGLKVKYTAYTVDEQDNPTNEEVPLPISRCGRFFIVASPEDTIHYRNNTSYAYYSINKAKISFDERTQYFEYDGKAHEVQINNVPDWIGYSVEYTEIDDKGNIIKKLGETSPVEKGRYMASVIVKSGDTVAESTAFIEMKITSGAMRLQAKEQDGEKDFLGDIGIGSVLLIAIPLAAIIALAVYFFVKSKKA
ncbi:MAG: hypothetical protein IJS94_03705, partial [Clostridia bacterium]|nr:hypothetical protein [Clostridia bacterium]